MTWCASGENHEESTTGWENAPRDGVVRTFQHEEYQVGFGMITIRFEKKYINPGLYINISELCEIVYGRPELKEGKSVVVFDSLNRFAAL